MALLPKALLAGNLLDAGGQVFNVRNPAYGAVGDAVADDGVAWNLARADVDTAGGIVLVPRGAYLLTTAFTFSAATNVLLWMLPGVVLTGSALPVPAGTNAILDWRSASQLRARAKRTTAQAIVTATLTDVGFDAEDFDTGAMHDNSTNNERLTIPTDGAGVYLFTANIEWASNATGRRQLTILHNVDGLIARTKMVPTTSFDTSQQASVIYEMAAAEFVTAEVFQDSGGNLDVNPGGLVDASCTLSATRLSTL